MKKAPAEDKFTLTEDRDCVVRAQGYGAPVRSSIIMKVRPEDEDGPWLLKASVSFSEHVGNVAVVNSRDEEVEAILQRLDGIEIHISGAENIAAAGAAFRFLSDEIARRVKDDKKGVTEYTGLAKVIERL